MFPRIKQTDSTNTDMPSHICCEEHRRQLLKFADLSQLLPNIDMTNLAFYFARQCQNNKKAARAARRLTAISQRSSTTNDDKSTSPFHIVDRLLAAPTGIYGTELNSRLFNEICTKKELISSFERYVKALTLDDYNVIPYAFDIQLKYRSLSFLSKQQSYNRLMSMTRINLKETKINRVHKGSMIQVHSIVDPFITPRSIQSIVEDENGNVIRIAIYNWYTILTDQSIEYIRNRIKRNRHFIIGNPFIKMAADGLLILRVDNPRLEMWFTDYEKEIEIMDADKLRDLGNKFFHNNEIHGAIQYYSLGLIKSPNDTRILSNRAECYLQGQLPHLALDDCERILDICTKNPTEENRDVIFTWKVHYRKMRALIGLQLFDQAKLSIDSLLECTQDASSYNEIIERFKRILECDIPRLQNEAEGNYDMFDLMSGRTRRADEFCAEFERQNVYEFRQCDKPEKGFGMFALCPLKPGTLLLVERPFAYVHSKSNETLVDDQSHIITFSLTQKPEDRSTEECGTNGGKYLRQTVLELLRQLEMRILIDHKQFIEKLSHLTPLRQQPLRKKSDDEDYYLLPYKVLIELYERNVIGSGLWPKLSRFNHSCLPNCFYIIINHLCFLSVIKPIEIGEELTICYLPSVYNSYIERTIRLREYYIDECQCKLCDYDRNIGQADMQQLIRQFEENEDDEEKRRYLFKHLIYQYSINRPLGFIEQMSQLKRSIKIDIFIEQIKHGYLAYPYILNYFLSHMNKYDKLENIIDELRREFAYFNWIIDDNDNTNNKITRFTDIIQLFVNFLED